MKNFGTSFIYKDSSSITSFQVKVSNSIIEVANKGYKIFDINPSLIGDDVEGNFSFVNCALRNSRLLNTLDVSLAQRVRERRSDALLVGSQCIVADRWVPVGTVLASGVRSLLRLDLSKDCVVELDLFFRKGEAPLIKSRCLENSATVFFEIGYVVLDSYCILLVKSEGNKIYPVVSDLLGTGLFMPTPSKEVCYSLEDYEIKEESEIVSIQKE